MKTAKEILASRSPMSLLATVDATTTAGMFVWAGYLEALKDAQLQGFNDDQMPGGQIDLAREIAVAVPLIVNMADEALSANPGPGVWEYDVAEVLGAWLFEQARANQQLPHTREIQDKAHQLTLAFIGEWRSDEKHAD